MFKLRTLSEISVFAKISTDGLCVSIKRKCFTHVVVWVRQLPHYSKILRIADKLTIITIVRYISKLAFSLSVDDTKIVFLNHFRILSLPSPAHAVLESIWFCPIPRCSLPISSIVKQDRTRQSISIFPCLLKSRDLLLWNRVINEDLYARSAINMDFARFSGRFLHTNKAKVVT